MFTIFIIIIPYCLINNMTAMIIKIMVMAEVIQKGANTQIQGQSITLQSFNITKAIPNKPPMPTPLLFESLI